MKRSSQGKITRRQLLQTLELSAGASLLFRHALFAAETGIVPTMVEEARKTAITTETVRRGISVLQGSGGNIAVLTGNDGKLLVDSGFAVSQPRLANALTAINTDPIKHLINTHWHTDHTDGNAWLHSRGAEITAHENTRTHLCTRTRVEGWQWTFPPAPPDAWPAHVFAGTHEMCLNNTRIMLEHGGPAHTDSDIRVHFTEADVVHLGDTWWNGVYPFIDYSTGGSIDGQVRAAEANVSKFSDGTIFIPGHGPIGRKSDVIRFRDMLVAVRAAVAALKKQGRSLDETIAAKPTSPYDDRWGQSLIGPAAFTALVYSGV